MTDPRHIRIDEGIKRGERQLPTGPGKYECYKGRPLRSVPQEVRTQILNAVLERYANGEQVAAMAPDYDLSDVTLYALLLAEVESPWKDLQTARALARLERANQDLIDALDPLSLARARELVRSAQWELERLLSRLYSPKQEVTHTIKPEFSVVLKDLAQEPVLIEGESKKL